MAIQHGTLAAPTGITATGVLLHELSTKEEDTGFEYFDEDGAFSGGKSLRTKTSFSLRGEALSTVALPTVGSGAATSASPHIDSTDNTEKSEGAGEFTIDAHYWSAGQGEYAA